MKKFLTVLLVIAVMFTFSFGSAFAAISESDMSNVITKAEALNYANTAYEKALKSLNAEVAGKHTFDIDGGYTFQESSVGYYVSKAAYESALGKDAVNKVNKEIVEAVYAKVVAAINDVANRDDFGGFVVGNSTDDGVQYPATTGKKYYGFDVTTTDGYKTAQKKYQMSYDAVKAYDKANDGTADFQAALLDINFDKLAYQEEFTVKKDAALTGIAAIDPNAYSDEYKNTEKSNRDKVKEDVAKALSAINGVTITTGTAIGSTATADVKKAIDAIADVYTPAVGKAKASGKLYEGGATTKVTLFDPALTEVTFTGLNNITKSVNQGDADSDLAYAKKKVLNTVLGALTNAEESVLAAQNAILRAQRDAETPDADKIADANNQIAKTEAAYDAAVTAIKYIVEYVDDVAELGTFAPDGTFAIKQDGGALAWDVQAGTPKTYATFKVLEIYTGAKTTPANGVFKGSNGVATPLTVATCENIADIVAKINKAAENDKLFVNLDGSYAVQIDKAVKDATEDAYIKGIYTYATPTNTSELTARKHELIDEGKVTINGKVYADTVMDWFKQADSITTHAADTYDKELNDEIRAIVKDTKDAIKAAKTIADADAAFVAGYEKYDALMTANEHYNAFALKNGALYDKYQKYKAQFTNYAEAAWKTIGNLKKDTDYSVKNLNALVNYYVGTSTVDGAFYKGIYDEAALDAVYAEALAAVDALKTKAQIKEMADAAVTAINAIPATVTIADKAAVAAAKDAYEAYTDYAVDMLGLDSVFAVDGTYVKALDKLTEADKAVKKAEQKAIKAVTDLFPNTVAKVTLADKDNVAKVRELVDAYVNDYVGKDAANVKNYAHPAKTGKQSYDELRNEALALTGLKYDSALGANDFVDYEKAVAEKQLEAVEEMIAKLSVSPVDATAVKAARAAYDAIPDNVFFDYKMDISDTAYDKLVALEKVVDKAVTSLKLNASSKAKKGSITVKWTVKGDASVAEGYQVWKSTKANKGYKKAITTKKTSYKNTKNLKKGKTYYYKVRAYATAADGTIMYSDWSNKAYRKAK